MSGIDYKALDTLMSDLDKQLKKFPGKRRKLHDNAGNVMVKNVKKNTPYDPDRDKGTHLRDAINKKVGSEGGYVAVRNDNKKAPHAHLIENGHIMVDHADRGKRVLTIKDGGTFVKGKHMFEKGLKESESELMSMVESLANEIVGDME